ncbi:MAG: hypothetical protein IPI83_07805 [Sphingomonadales bacterium]|nr:hypothetical protein [Sphingomonadales bacterium]
MGFSLMAGNFGAMATENMGKVAGMASSCKDHRQHCRFGVRNRIGRAFDGTTVPLYRVISSAA